MFFNVDVFGKTRKPGIGADGDPIIKEKVDAGL